MKRTRKHYQRRSTNGPYQLIVLDPPWLEVGGGGRGADSHYECHSVTDIVSLIHSLEINGSPAYMPDPEGCQVWIWTTMNRLLDTFQLMDMLGLHYITHRVWVKADDLSVHFNKILGYLAGSKLFSTKTLQMLDRAISRGVWTLQRFGLGQYVRGNHEIAILAHHHDLQEGWAYREAQEHEVALLCRYGKTHTHNRATPSVLLAPRTSEHSEKPAQFYVDCLNIAGNVRALDLFSRDPRPGYECAGDQLGTEWRKDGK